MVCRVMIRLRVVKKHYTTKLDLLDSPSETVPQSLLAEARHECDCAISTAGLSRC